MSDNKITPSQEALAAITAIEERARSKHLNDLDQDSSIPEMKPVQQSTSFGKPTTHNVRSSGILDASRNTVTRPHFMGSTAEVKGPSPDALKRRDQARMAAELKHAEQQHERQRIAESLTPEKLHADLAAKRRLIQKNTKEIKALKKDLQEALSQLAYIREQNL